MFGDSSIHGMRISLTCYMESDAGRIPFAYLEDIHMRFMKNYGKVANTALAYAMNDEFSRVLHQQMEYFSTNKQADAINRVKGEIAEVSFHDEASIFLYEVVLF